MRRSRRKGRQSVEHLVRRYDRLLEPELQYAEGRLTKLQYPGAGGSREGCPRTQRFNDTPLVGLARAERPGEVGL